MSDIRNIHPKVLSLVVDFSVLCASFFVACLLFSAAWGNALFIQILAYSTLLLVCVRLSKRAIISYNRSIGEVSRHIVGNGAGILIGTCIMLVLENLVSASADIFVTVIFSSVMAFFILGTLLPIVHRTPISHKPHSSF